MTETTLMLLILFGVVLMNQYDLSKIHKRLYQMQKEMREYKEQILNAIPPR